MRYKSIFFSLTCILVLACQSASGRVAEPGSETPITDVAPAVAGVGNSVYFFAKALDGRIIYQWADLGKGKQGWREMGGASCKDMGAADGWNGNYRVVAN